MKPGLIQLMLWGQILFGVAALPTGWLGDRWSAVGMMVVYFVGTGSAAVLAGFARSPLERECRDERGLAANHAF